MSETLNPTNFMIEPKNGYLTMFFPSEKAKCNILQLYSLAENEKLLYEIVENLWPKVANF